MLRNSLLLFGCALLLAGLVACPGPQQQEAEQPAQPEQPQMTEEQMIADIQAKCICASCPSWVPECTEKGEKGGYCAVGKSGCITQEQGCVCPQCPVTQEKGLKYGYYCTRGSAKEQAEMEAAKQVEPEGGQ